MEYLSSLQLRTFCLVYAESYEANEETGQLLFPNLAQCILEDLSVCKIFKIELQQKQLILNSCLCSTVVRNVYICLCEVNVILF